MDREKKKRERVDGWRDREREENAGQSDRERGESME